MKRSQWVRLSAEERRAHADPRRLCIEHGCDEPAGTPWCLLWCADHDDQRIQKVRSDLAELQKGLR